ncbi:SDR family NAD(P)-dependent oxidoreductase [Motilibacter deserti]|uniref:SDR family oxidoreductase n=1 Tax=Motilibacter deserti TaxID=2714956 RepID=A0ABX0GWP9_9ACTN|nr:SDR family oxidoreductase [Motilibacter deserti]NHC14060.1 SDR family oxidoreductase [Motilibacter deserti]
MTAPSRVAVVSGATGGIGRAVALGLARAGLAVGLLGRDPQRLEAVRSQVAAEGATVVAVSGDLTRREDVERAVAECAVLGTPDLVVAAAGRIEQEAQPLWESDPDEWWGVVEANLRVPYLLARAFVPGMLAAGGGRFVDLSSGLAVSDQPGYSAYAASKAALFRLTGALHAAGHSRGLRAFELAPGVVATAMTAGMAVHRSRPADRWTAGEEVARWAVALARGDLDGLSGRFLRVDTDTVEGLAARVADGLPADARTLRLRGWGADDSLA